MTEHIGSLKPDPKNARRHTPRNVGMIVSALHEVGAARSIVIDEDNTILAGNATVEAAAQAGIERLKVVEADGNTIVAVRRRGLTPEQKARLALFDNRAAELAEWEPEVLAALNEEIDLGSLWNDDELERVLASLPDEDDWASSIGGLPDGDKPPFQQMTFTLHDDQAEMVKRALDAAKDMGPFTDTGNENSNGNALARVCEVFLGATSG